MATRPSRAFAPQGPATARRSSVRIGIVAVCSVLVLVSSLITSLTLVGAASAATEANSRASRPAGKTANPTTNVAPCSSTWIAAINCARRDEGIRPLPIQTRAFAAMTIPQQLFALVDYERVARGLPPFGAMTTRLNATAQVGANKGIDPPLGAITSWSWGGAVWSGGILNAAGALYLWMYQDGYTPVHGFNLDCQQPGDAGCWGHRDNLLHPAISCGPGKSPSLVVGAATNREVAGGSLAMTLLASCSGIPGAETFTWRQAEARASGH